MNGKQAKRLRRAALGLGTALTEAGRDIKKDGYVVKKHEHHVPSASSYISDPVRAREMEAAEEKERHLNPTYQLFVRPDSVKAIYKKMKSGRTDKIGQIGQ